MVNNFIRGANRFSRHVNNFVVCSIFGQYSSFLSMITRGFGFGQKYWYECKYFLKCTPIVKFVSYSYRWI